MGILDKFKRNKGRGIPMEQFFEAGDILLKADSLAEIGRYKEALKLVNKALKMSPEEELWGTKGRILFLKAEYGEAIKCYDKALALQIQPRNANLWYQKGVSLINLKRFDEAMSCFDMALEIDADFIKAWTSKGTCLLNESKFDEAINCFNKVIEINRREFNAWSAKGIALMGLKKYDEAIKCFDESLRINPLDEPAIQGKKQCLRLKTQTPLLQSLLDTLMKE